MAVLAGLASPFAHSGTTTEHPALAFADITKSAGLKFTLTSGTPQKLYIPEAMSGGVAFVDYDNDGWPDIYLVDGSTLATERAGGSRNGNRLYHNNHDNTFTDVTARAGVGGHNWGMGVCAGDVNNDGFADLFVTNLGPDILYLNNGDGTFRDATRGSGLGDPRWNSSCAFGDFDGDGDLDLYVTAYAQFDVRNPPETIDGQPCRNPAGIRVMCGPVGLTPIADRLYENVGNGHFVDVTARSGIGRSAPSFGLGAVWFDSDGDGDLDLYVANDRMPNFLFRNNGNGTFTDIGATSGTALSFDGRPQGSMGVDVADYDDDGDFDIVVANYADDYDSLYRNEGGNAFSDGSTPGGLVGPTLPLVGWGVQFVDLDLDGRQDLPIANGHVYPTEVATGPKSAGYRQRNLLFWNAGHDRFFDVARAQPDLAGFQAPTLGRGLAVADINNDGLPDLLISNLDAAPTLLLNRTVPRGRWLTLKLVGSTSNRSAIGAIAAVRTGARVQRRLVKSGGSYQSQSDFRLYFGLGGADRIDNVTVTWPSGRKTAITGVTPNQILTIKEP